MQCAGHLVFGILVQYMHWPVLWNLVFFRAIYAVGMVFGAVHCESEPARAKTIEPL